MKTGNVTIHLVCFVLFVYLPFSGCSGKRGIEGGEIPSEVPQNVPPSWYTSPPLNDNEYYYATGSSEENEEAAKMAAMGELIMKFAPTHVRVETRLKTTSTIEGESEDIRKEYISNSAAFAKQEGLPGYDFPEKAVTGAGYYVLARIRKETLEQYWETMWKDAEKAVNRGDIYLESRKVVPALVEYAVALEIVRLLKPDLDRVTLESINRKIREVDSNLEINKEGKALTGEYGGRLKDPLVVKILYKDQPLRDFPLKAVYVRGIGMLNNEAGQTGKSVSFKTDGDGKGHCWVDRIDSISWENLVQITPDVQNSIPLSNKEAVFRYTSKFPKGELPEPPTVYLDNVADDQEFFPGHIAELKIEPLPRDCWIHLFIITAKGDFAYNQSVEINEAYDGDGWSITPEEPPWTFKLQGVSLVRDQGDGLESILVVTTLKACELDIKELTGKRLIHELNEQVGEGQWNADSITYWFK